MMFYVIIFVGALYGPQKDMRPVTSIGPFLTTESCYTGAALAVDRLDGSNPTRDFRAICITSDKRVRHHGQPVYSGVVRA